MWSPITLTENIFQKIIYHSQIFCQMQYYLKFSVNISLKKKSEHGNKAYCTVLKKKNRVFTVILYESWRKTFIL